MIATYPPGPGDDKLAECMAGFGGQGKLEFLASLRKEYGSIFSFPSLGGTRTICVIDGDLARTVYRDDENFWRGPGADVFRRVYGNNMLLADGDEHTRQRKPMARMFTEGAVLKLMPALQEIIEDRMSGWQDGQEIDMAKWVSETVWHMLCKAQFGTTIDYSVKTDLVGPFLDLALAAAYNPDLVPERDRIAKLTWEFIDDIYDECRRKADNANNIIGMFFQLEDAGEWDRDTVIKNMLAFFNAGEETTSSLGTSTIHQTARRRDYWEMARAEALNAEDLVQALPDLNYLRALGMESGRLYSSTLITFRTNKQEMEFAGYTIAPNTQFLLVPPLTHREDQHWPDALNCTPNRFLVKQGPMAANMRYYLSFGDGKHKCLGMTFGTYEAMLITANVVRRVARLEVPDTIEYDYGTVLRPLSCPATIRFTD